MKQIILFFTLIICTIAPSFSQNTITNKDVIAMHSAKISEDLILSKIAAATCDFELTAKGLIWLKDAKISEKVLLKMIEASPPTQIFQNEDIISLVGNKFSIKMIKGIIFNSPHEFDTSPDGLIQLTKAKVPKAIVKEMMANPTKLPESTAKAPNEYKNENENIGHNDGNNEPKNNKKEIQSPKKPTQAKVDQKKCKPIETTDLETNEKYILYGNTFNVGGALGMLAGNSESTKEYISVFGGFRGDKTIVLFQLDRVVGGKVQNKTNLKDLYVKKGEKIIIITPNENIPFYTIGESRSTYKKELTGISLGDQERISVQGVCLATKSQIEKLSTAEIKEVVFVTTNGNTSRVRPSKGELKKFEEKINCLMETEKYRNSPETPTMELTSDEALAELKKAKEKYELGLITKEEYEKARKEMIKYIK